MITQQRLNIPTAVSICYATAQLVTPGMFSELKRELRQREAAGWARVHWGLPQPPQLSEMEVVHGRLIYLNPKVPSLAG